MRRLVLVRRGGTALAGAAEARMKLARVETEAREASGRAFDAWEDELRIVVAAIPAGARIERCAAAPRPPD